MRSLVIVGCGLLVVVAGFVAVAGGLAWAGRTRTPDQTQFWPTAGEGYVAVGEDAMGPAYVVISYLPMQQASIGSTTTSSFGATSALVRLSVDDTVTEIPMRRHPLLIVVPKNGEPRISNLSDKQVAAFQRALQEAPVVDGRLPAVEVAERVLLNEDSSVVSDE